MKTAEDIFLDMFNRWWRDQTTPQKMTWEKATWILANCQAALKKELVPEKMTQDVFDGHLKTAQKVVLFGLSWTEAKAKKWDDLLHERKVPKR